MTKLAPEWVRTSDPVIRSPAHYRWTTAPAAASVGTCNTQCREHLPRAGHNGNRQYTLGEHLPTLGNDGSLGLFCAHCLG